MTAFYPSGYYSVSDDPEVRVPPGLRRRAASFVAASALHGNALPARLAAVAAPDLGARNFAITLRKVGALTAGRPKVSLLDVGCGSGMLVFGLSLVAGVDVEGVDPFATGDRTFSTGAQLRRGALDDVDDTFDVIMFHHSLEHTRTPQTVLTLAGERLKPGGRVLVRVPTVSSQAYEEYGSDWIQLDAPRHLFLPSREGLERLVHSAALQVVDRLDDSAAFQFWGSEQARRGIALTSRESWGVDPSASALTRRQIINWALAARRANKAGRGDQVSWVLEPTAPTA